MTSVRRDTAWGRGWASAALGALALAACAAQHEVSSLDAGAPPGGPKPSEYGCTSDDAGAPRICDFAHMAFRVGDLAKARAFYGAFLGFSEPFELAGGVAVFKIDDDQYIEVDEATALAGDTNYQLEPIAFSTSDAEGLRRLFASKGIAVPAAVTKNRLGNTSFTTVDPDGHLVEWVQYEKDSLTGKTRGQSLAPSRIAGRVHHLGVTITDPAAATVFYQAVGFVTSKTADKDAMRAPNAMVRIEYGVTHSAPTKPFAVVRDHLCLRVTDTMEAVRLLAGRDPSARVEHHVLDGFTVRANVYDPEGTRIELADSVLSPQAEATGAGDEGELDSGSTEQ